MIQNGMNELFNFCDDDSNVLILNKYLPLFVPSVTFHFDKSPNEINFGKIIKHIPKDMIIINIEEGSTFLTVAFINSGNTPITIRRCKEKIQPLVAFFNNAIGKSIVGNLIEIPEITNETQESAESFFKRKTINLLQLDNILDERKLNMILSEVKRRLRSFYDNTNYQFIFKNRSLYEEAEKAVRLEIENNEIDLAITGVTIFANKKYNEFKESEERMPNKVELFVYHGTKFESHSRIAKEGLYTPDEREEKTNIPENDPGYFGRGIYATNNIFYALMYSSTNQNQFLEIGHKNSVICCKAIYNQEYLVYLNDLENCTYYNVNTIFFGSPFDDEIQRNKGVHQIYVDSSSNFHPPEINKKINKEKRKSRPSYVTAYEYVFPNSEQIIPVLSLTVKRPKYFILWLCERTEYKKYMERLRYRRTLNFFYKSNIDDAFQLVDRKKRSKLKFIISVNSIKWCREYINRIRDCHQNNFLCMIFSQNKKFIDLAKEMENVLYTDDIDLLKKFTRIKLLDDENDNNNNGKNNDNDNSNDEKKYKEITDFYRELETKYNIEFNIKKDLLFKFYPGKWDIDEK